MLARVVFVSYVSCLEEKRKSCYYKDMIITWYGQSCFKIESKDRTIIIDPFLKSIGLTPPSGQADIVFVTHDHQDHNNIAAVKGEYLLINSPGEYEAKGVRAQGIESFHDDAEGAKRGLNTLYLIEAEGIRIVHAGDLGQPLLLDRQIEEIGSVDILMIPVGGFFTIAAKEAVGIINQLEPKIVIPMHYKVPGLLIKELDGVEKFLQEFGEEDGVREDKLTLKQKDLESEGGKTRVVLFKI